jgi:hypothetical protein
MFPLLLLTKCTYTVLQLPPYVLLTYHIAASLAAPNLVYCIAASLAAHYLDYSCLHRCS